MPADSKLQQDYNAQVAMVVASFVFATAVAFVLRKAPQSPAEAFADIVARRYACKEYDPNRQVPDSVLRTIMDLTQRAPTSFNTQPWIAIVVRDTQAKRRLVDAMAAGNQPKVEAAPLSIVFAADTEPEKLLTPATPEFVRNALPMFVGQCSTPEAWAFKQTMMAVQTFLLAATSHGLATTPMEGFESVQAVRDAVGLPQRYGVPVVVALGFEKAPPAKASVRRPSEDVWFFDRAPAH